jgi:hypothetical protein
MAHSSSSGAASLLWKSYVKENEVGRGRYAKVYKAREVGTHRVLAVKVFDKLGSRSEDARRRQDVKIESKMLDAVRSGVSVFISRHV